MDCVCHGLPAYWQKDRRHKDGGWWECGVKRRDRQRRVYAETGPTPERRARSLAYWHRADGGYIRARRRKLADQRTRIVEQIAQLDQEATEC